MNESTDSCGLEDRDQRPPGAVARRPASGAVVRRVFAIHALLLAACTAEPTQVATGSAPVLPVENLVIICLDTVRRDTFGMPELHGVPDRLSPWLERSVRFENARSTSSWTIPAVASVMTGLYPVEHGAGRFASLDADLSDEVPSALDEGVETLAEQIRAAGLETAAFVAHPWFGPQFGLAQGFETLQMHTSAESLVGLASDWVEQRRVSGERFLLYLHFMEAHEAHFDRNGRREFWSSRLSDAERSAAVAAAPPGLCSRPTERRCDQYSAYTAAVRHLRETVADVLDRLRATELLDQTAVLVYSDHGEEFFEHEVEQRALAVDPRGLAGIGHGHTLYEEVLRVPLVVWHPGHPGRRSERLTSLAEIAPAALTWLGMEAGDATGPGLDLLDPTGVTSAPSSVFASGIAYGPQQAAVISDEWKLVARTRPVGRELFHLATDPEERTDAKDESRRQELTGMLRTYLRRPPRAAATVAPEVTSEELKQLQSLGYLGGGG